jgi:DNA-3-methyladenine glycosylase I
MTGTSMPQIRRCPWATTPLGIAYHDHEWGVPVHAGRRLFEFLVLEGTRAGLSWETIPSKREAYRLAFDGFDPRLVTAFDRGRIQRLMGNAGIVRNRLKIESVVRNARAFLEIQNQFGGFDSCVWRFVGG